LHQQHNLKVWLFAVSRLLCTFLQFDFIGGWPKPGISFLPGRLRRTLLPEERYGDSLGDWTPNVPVERQQLHHSAIAAVHDFLRCVLSIATDARHQLKSESVACLSA